MSKHSEARKQIVETRCLTQRQPLVRGRRNLDRRSFLRASAAAFGATVGIAAAHAIPAAGVAFASEAAGSREKSKKGPPSKNLRAARCPVTGERVSEEASIDFKGGRLYFSGVECLEKFSEDRAKYEAKANAQLVITGQFKQTHCPLCGDEVVPAIRTKVCGVDVSFCSSECLRKVKRASVDQRAEMVFGEAFSKAFATTQEKAAAGPADKWQCVVCGYVHKGSTPPAKCPKCDAKSDSFVAMR